MQRVEFLKREVRKGFRKRVTLRKKLDKIKKEDEDLTQSLYKMSREISNTKLTDEKFLKIMDETPVFLRLLMHPFDRDLDEESWQQYPRKIIFEKPEEPPI